MVFQQPNDLSTGSSYARGLENPSQYDTGFIRIIPTGENYQNISEHTYKKVYNQVYDAEYLAGVSTTSTLYQSTYTTTFNNYKTQNYSSTKTAVSSEISVGVRQSLVAEYFESDRMKQYYQQRYNEYYNEGRINATKDGTTIPSAANPTLWNKDASTKYALQNTYEMIEILYGNRSADTVPSTQWTQGVTRVNHIDPKVAQTVEIVTQERLNLEGDKVAKAAATNAIKELELLAVNNATQAAKTAAAQTSVGSLRTKADVFIYGLALSKSDNSLSSRYSNQGFNWGSADNPWLFRAGTEKVKQFKNIEKDVGYLALEAPLATTTPTESDNNIKLGFWTDIFSRQLNSSAEIDPSTGAPKSGLDKEHRLRTQFIANGLSLNGSQTRLFQTLDSDNPNHHQTLGMASVLRLNTNDNPANLSFTDSNLDSKGIRISTAAKSDTLDGTAVTPAIDGSLAPVFHDTEGLYLYSPNINLVLGNMYQPFVVGSEGNNIVLEVTRIPNVPEIYNKIYQNYEDGKGGYLGSTAFTGSTCNVVSCGTPLKANANDSAAIYQGRNATHSSIAIGTVERLPNNMLRAKDHDNATGVVFKGVDGTAKNLGSVAIDGVLIQHLKFKTTGL